MRKFYLILSLLLSSACATSPKVVVKSDPVYLKVTCVVQPDPAPIVTRTIKPKVIEDKVGIFWVGFTPQDYENLAINTQSSIRYIKDTRQLVAYYLGCIERFNAHIEGLEAAE